MKKKISIIMTFIFVFVLAFSFNFNALGAQKDTSTDITFVTADDFESNFISNIDSNLKDKKFLEDNKIGKIAFDKLGKTIKIKSIKKADQLGENPLSEETDSIAISYSLLKSKKVLEYAKKQLDSDKNILFYGKNIDLVEFCSMFGLEDCLPKGTDIKASNNIPGYNEDNDLHGTKRVDSIITFVGVDSTENGKVLVTSEGSTYNFYRVVERLLADAIYSKKAKVEKPYKDLKKSSKETKENNIIALSKKLFSGTTTFAADIDDFPIINNQRKETEFNNDFWYLITDCYLHRVGSYSDDPDYDYFMLETICELDCAYDPGIAADRFFTKLKPAYSDDKVRSGGPEDQGATNEINVDFYPPSVGFTYIPGEEMSVDSTFSLSNNYFKVYFKATGLLFPFWTEQTIHRPILSFSNYAPSSSYTYVKIYLDQEAREWTDGSPWETAFYQASYYYNY